MRVRGGRVLALTERSGNLAAYYEYDAWGNTMTEAEKTGVDNPYRYSTKEWDEKSGLYYFGARYYDPEIGRWTQREPLGWFDGPNMYAYVRNQAANLIDAFGIYGQATHEFLTAMLGRHAGYSEKLASQIGRCNQMVDEKWPAETSLNLQDRIYSRAYHFTTQQRRNFLREKAFADCDPCFFGIYLHALQDSYAHEGYGPMWGHFSAGRSVDYMGNDPDKAMSMAIKTYTELKAFRQACCDKLKDGLVHEPDKMLSFLGELREAIFRDRPPVGDVD